MKVKIKSCNEEKSWYKTEIGKTFTVDCDNTDWYIVKMGLGLGSVLKTDAEIVSDEICTNSILLDVIHTQKVAADAIAGNYIPGKDFMMHLGTDTMLREFPTGAKRDTNTGKPRPDLIHWTFLEALGHRLALGAEKYGENNYQKGIPNEVAKESLMRHIVAIMADKTDEDHLSAAAANLMFLVYNRDK